MRMVMAAATWNVRDRFSSKNFGPMFETSRFRVNPAGTYGTMMDYMFYVLHLIFPASTSFPSSALLQPSSVRGCTSSRERPSLEAPDRQLDPGLKASPTTAINQPEPDSTPEVGQNPTVRTRL